MQESTNRFEFLSTSRKKVVREARNVSRGADLYRNTYTYIYLRSTKRNLSRKYAISWSELSIRGVETISDSTKSLGSVCPKIYLRKKKKNAWRTIGEYRCAVIRAYSETWEKKKKKEREKKDSRKRGTGSMEVSGERSTRKLSGIQSGSLLASERQRDARTENKVAAAIGLAPLLLLSRPPRLSLDPTHGGGLLFLNLRRSRNARVAAVFS